MKYVNVNEIAAKWNLSERSVRNYCAHGKIPGAEFLAIIMLVSHRPLVEQIGILFLSHAHVRYKIWCDSDFLFSSKCRMFVNKGT